jgi:small-conductance mechanosensitive channel
MTPLATALLRTATPDAGMGPDELVDLLPDLVRAGWFLVGFLLVLLVALFVGAGAAGFGQVLQNSALVIAAGTLAIGVAGQTVIGSLVSGLALVADPEFNVGNYIEWADREGEVRSITLRVTRVHTPDGELVTIPNTTLTSEAVARPYGRGRSRVVERIGIAYEDDVDDAPGTPT